MHLFFYHGTTRDAVDSILKTGLRATEERGGSDHRGVCLSSSHSDARHWSKMTLLKRAGLPVDASRLDEVSDEEVAVLRVEVPLDRKCELFPRRKPCNLPGDVQFAGPVPVEWITVVE